MQTIIIINLNFSYHVSHSTIIDETCCAVWNVLMPEYMKMSNNAEECREVSNGFNSLRPNVTFCFPISHILYMRVIIVDVNTMYAFPFKIIHFS